MKLNYILCGINQNIDCIEKLIIFKYPLLIVLVAISLAYVNVSKIVLGTN